MGLKCQLLGHAYGNPEVERSREEQGDEVVVTVRNVKVCERCGDEQMVNQTKEVTSVRSPEEVGLETGEQSAAPGEPAGDAPEATPAGAESADSPVTPVEPDAAGSAAPSPAEGGETAADTGGDEPTVEPAAERVDDGVVADATVSAPGEGDDAADSRDGADAGGAVDGGDAETASDARDGWETGSDGWDDVDPDIDDAVILDAGETERDEVQWPEASEADSEAAETSEAEAEWAGEATGSDDAGTGPDDGHASDAEIIDGADVATGRDPDDGATGSWPDHDDATGSWPDHDGADEGYAATPNGDVDAEFDGEGLTPEVNGSAVADAAGVDGIAVHTSDGRAAGESSAADADGVTAGADEGFVRAAESEPSEPDVPDDRVEFYCPNCGYAGTAGASSMRAGDICPECKRGYIAERES